MRRNLFNVILGLLIAGIIGLAGCGGGGGSGTPAAPPSVDATGTWSGPYNSSVFGARTMTVNLQQSGASLTGTYSSTTGGLGSISGSVSGNTASLTITVTTPGCSGSFNGTGIVTVPQVGAPTMSFSYNGASNAACGGQESGTGNLTKQ